MINEKKNKKKLLNPIHKDLFIYLYMKCIHCGVNYSYYNGPKHASRQSCRVSPSGYHAFVSNWDWFWSFFDCKKSLCIE